MIGRAEAVRRLKLLTKELLRRQARYDPNAFLMYVMRDQAGQPLRQAQIHKDLQAHLSKYNRALVIFPRYHGKTTQILGRILWELGKNPELRVKVVCAREDLARKRVKLLREIISARQVREVFPGLRPAPGNWSARSITVVRQSGAIDPSVEAYGVTTSATGDRCDLLVLDDVTDDRNSLFSKRRRDEVHETVVNKWFNLLHPAGGRIWWIGTPWHSDDALMRMRRSGSFAVFERRITEDLKPLWPEVWPKERLIQQQQAIGSHAFARAFHCKPVSSEELLFKEEYISEEDLPSEGPFIYYMGMDLAFSAKPGSDRTAIVTVCQHGPKAYVVDAWARRGVSITYLKRFLPEYAKRFAPGLRAIFIESVQAQAEIVRELASTLSLPIYPQSTGNLPKELRLCRLASLLESGLVVLKRPVEGQLKELVQELLEYPHGRHDDLADALCYAVSQVRQVGSGIGVRVTLLG